MTDEGEKGREAKHGAVSQRKGGERKGGETVGMKEGGITARDGDAHKNRDSRDVERECKVDAEDVPQRAVRARLQSH
jgi:hypothetical protein